ncbi:CATRA system-associated protein [Micromonospora sp. WMMD1274]|uniref:CATRA system-associated protein n=1 Tax=Micromonospora sp. WMMD1274 TaxID=3404116 RepID=UPI003B954E0A
MNLEDSWDDETAQDAVDVLQDLVLWEMTAQRWEHIAEILRRIERAWDTGEAIELRDAITDLEINGPVRIMRIGSKTVTGIPKPVLDQRNTLVHKLTSETRNTPEDERGRQQPR